LDSTPGKPHFTNLCADFKQTLPENKIISFAVMAVGGLVLCGYLVCYASKAPIYTVVNNSPATNIGIRKYQDIPSFQSLINLSIGKTSKTMPTMQ